MAYTAADVKNLREMTGVGMLDCKKALAETDGDMDKAVEYLREKGLAAAQKKAGRIAAEGIAYAEVFEGGAALVEVNSETDFVAKNDKFIDFVKDVCYVVGKWGPENMEALLALPYRKTGLTVQQALQEIVLAIGENIQIRRFERYYTGTTVAYNHMGGRIGVLLNMEVSEGLENNETVNEGLCIKCAKELNIKPIAQMIDSMGISEDELEDMCDQMGSMMGGGAEKAENAAMMAGPEMLKMLGSFTILRLIGMLPKQEGAPEITKEQLLAINEKLNQIPLA